MVEIDSAVNLESGAETALFGFRLVIKLAVDGVERTFSRLCGGQYCYRAAA